MTSRERDIASEILEGIREIKRGEHGRVQIVPPVADIRNATGLSQRRFAELLGVSVRTLQEWEQGRRAPSGAARTLLRIVAKNPQTLVDVSCNDNATYLGTKRAMPNAPGSTAKNERLLADHRRVGKRLTPPLLTLGGFHEVSWLRTGIPETLWLMLCHASHAPREAVRLAEKLVQVLIEVLPDHEQFNTFSVSNLGAIAEEYRSSVRENLAAEGDLFLIQRSLDPARILYPEFPMKWLWSASDQEHVGKPVDLSRFKEMLASQFDKTSRDAMFVQTTLIHMAFASGRLHVRDGLTLANYASVADYPLTDESRLAAASVRATVNLLLKNCSRSDLGSWPQYFWNHGLQLEPCQTPQDFPFLDVYAQNTTVDR